ncbi:MAG: MATE family efflux transporter [Porticoccaceae bacterium]
MQAVSTFSIWRLTWPTMLSNMFFMLVGIAFLKIAANLGTDEVAAATTGQRLLFVVQAITLGLCSGTTAMVGKYWGAGDKEMAGHCAALSLLIFSFAGLLLSWLPIPWLQQIIGLFGLSAKAQALAIDFTFWTAVFAPPMLSSLILSMSFRAIGDSFTPLWISIISSCSAIVLASALTLGWGGLPTYELSGLAIGGGIAFAISTLLFTLLWIFGLLSFKPHNPLTSFKIHGKKLVDIGAPAAFEQAVFQVGVIVFLAFLTSYGNEAFAAYGIGLSILGLIIVMAFSFSMSSATLVSQHLGAGDHQGAYRAGWRTMRSCVYFMLVGALIMALSAEQIARFMSDDEAVIQHMITLIYILSLSLPLMGIEFSMAGALRGAGDTRFPMLVTLFSMLLSRIFIPWLLVEMGAEVVWLYAISILDFAIKSSLNMVRFRSKTWMKLDQQIPATHN